MLFSHFRVHTSAISDIGYVRKRNEDAWKYNLKEGFFILADGMGGQNSGDIAANECVEKLAIALIELRNKQSKKAYNVHDCEAQLMQIIIQVNNEIYSHATSDPNLYGMGTTLCVAYFFEDKVVYGHVGDSRIYRYHPEPSLGENLQQLTQDHSLASELVASGEITQDKVKSFPLKHVLTRAMGTNPTVLPTVSYCDIETQDLFLICSDGMTNYSTDKEIEDILYTSSHTSLPASQKIERCAQELVSLAKQNGGGDNITVILIYVDDISRQ